VIFLTLAIFKKISSVNFLHWWAPFVRGHISIAYSAYTILMALERKESKTMYEAIKQLRGGQTEPHQGWE
jgi:hypothetical protein